MIKYQWTVVFSGHDWPHLLIQELCERIALDQNPKNSPQHVDHVMVNLTGSSYQTHLLVGYVPWGSPRSRLIRPWPWPTHTIVLRKKCVWKWNVIPKYSLKYRENISVSTRWKKTGSFPLKILIHDEFSTIGGPTDWFHLTTPQFIGSLCMVSSKLLREIAARCHHFNGLRPILSCDVA